MDLVGGKGGNLGELTGAKLPAYRKLGSSTRVAVRSSGTSEDAGDTSFAGMNASFTNVSGEADLLYRVVDCWASLYGQRVISYRSVENVTDEPAIVVIVQEMVPSRCSGVIFTADRRPVPPIGPSSRPFRAGGSDRLRDAGA